MAERPLPEAIRGSWFYYPISADPRKAGDKPLLVYRFRLDGTFNLYTVRDGNWIDKEKGDYTFDGQFLIIRGRNTDTYRVRPKLFWKWTLEGKKEDCLLARGIADDENVSLTPEQQKEIRILPIRVSVLEQPGGTDGIYQLVYHVDEEEIVVGSIFVEYEPDEGRMWIGLSQFTQDIEPKTWERIVRESFLDIHMGKPNDINVVTLRTLHDNESTVFNYAIA